ncbi:hypothetical protein SAMN05444008_102416 [Cnuella takakiae]|uniref:Uncharacterized protein n=1 Tax=Cnuella takakiae TaxID=1302690 RepID=A0A1M4VXG5_9BACT|nr:hypothetical protein BUE76_11670 [Cnuella takakiae]SHE73647.1 hypothetical protein SAMN05444008_102416 [Cnuella takakiae]
MATDKELNRLREEVRIMKASAKSLLDNATRIEQTLDRLHEPALPSGNVLTALDKQKLRDGLRKKSLKNPQ